MDFRPPRRIKSSEISSLAQQLDQHHHHFARADVKNPTHPARVLHPQEYKISENEFFVVCEVPSPLDSRRGSIDENSPLLESYQRTSFARRISFAEIATPYRRYDFSTPLISKASSYFIVSLHCNPTGPRILDYFGLLLPPAPATHIEHQHLARHEQYSKCLFNRIDSRRVEFESSRCDHRVAWSRCVCQYANRGIRTRAARTRYILCRRSWKWIFLWTTIAARKHVRHHWHQGSVQYARSHNHIELSLHVFPLPFLTNFSIDWLWYACACNFLSN